MSYVVDYKRLKRIDVSDPKEKFNLTHLGVLLIALLILCIFKRVKDKKSYPQP